MDKNLHTMLVAIKNLQLEKLGAYIRIEKCPECDEIRPVWKDILAYTRTLKISGSICLEDYLPQCNVFTCLLCHTKFKMTGRHGYDYEKI